MESALDAYQIVQAQAGDERAFALLYTRWQPRFLRLALRLLQNRDDAQDVVQDAAISIGKSLRKLDDPARFSSFCYTIIRRRAADHIGRKARARAAQQALSDLPPVAAMDTEQNLALRQAMAKLNVQERLMLSLFYIDCFTGAEIAAALGVPLGTVKSRLFTARAHLKAHYQTTHKTPTGEHHDIK